MKHFPWPSSLEYSGVVKGTLYLYFNTREEVFLTLYNRSLQRWGERFTQCLVQGMSDYDYVKLLYQTASADGLFIPLLVRLEHVIEHNVAMDSLVASKRQFIDQINNIANRIRAHSGFKSTPSRRGREDHGRFAGGGHQSRPRAYMAMAARKSAC